MCKKTSACEKGSKSKQFEMYLKRESEIGTHKARDVATLLTNQQCCRYDGHRIKIKWCAPIGRVRGAGCGWGETRAGAGWGRPLPINTRCYVSGGGRPAGANTVEIPPAFITTGNT